MIALLTASALFIGARSEIECADDYTCYEDTERDVVWVKTDFTVLSFNRCKSVCEDALSQTEGVFHSCDPTQETIDRDTFEPIANAMGFSCPSSKNGCGWDGLNHGSIWVSTADSGYDKTCYFPGSDVDTFSCTAVPGNANCF